MRYFKFLRSPQTEGSTEGSGPGEGDIYDGSAETVEDTSPSETETQSETKPEAVEQPNAEPNQNTQTPQATVQQQAANASANVPQRLSDEDIARIQGALRPQEAPIPKTKSLEEKGWHELTPDEFNKKTNRIVVDATMLEAIGILDASPDQIQGFQTILDGVAKHALSMASQVFDAKLKTYDGQFSGMRNAYQSYERDTAQKQFYDAHPYLKGQDNLLKLVSQNISPNRQDGSPKSLKEVSDEIATNAKAILANAGVNLDNPQQAQPAPQQRQNSVPRSNTLAAPGRSSQGSQAQQKSGPSEASIYD